MNVTRTAYDQHGLRTARCEHCAMIWIEGRDAVELLPGSGEYTTPGGRPHTCPEPYPYLTALTLANIALAAGVGRAGPVVMSQRERARIRLGLAQDKDSPTG